MQAIKSKGMEIIRNDFRLISEWILHELSVSDMCDNLFGAFFRDELLVMIEAIFAWVSLKSDTVLKTLRNKKKNNWNSS